MELFEGDTPQVRPSRMARAVRRMFWLTGELVSGILYLQITL